jgi:hypothetical protein
MILMLLMSTCVLGQECAQTDIQQAYITFSTNEQITISEAIYSLSETTRVKFALGNLMYNPSTNTWKIANEQYDYVGGWWQGSADLKKGWHGTIVGSYNTNENKTNAVNIPDYTGWIDLFQSATADTINLIVDTFTYRTPTQAEFTYLVYHRPMADSLRARARITLDDGTFVNGMMLLPDSSVIKFIPNQKTFKSDADGCCYFTDNVFTRREWKIIEAQGIIFLPACGSAGAQKYDRSGFYWTRTKPASNRGITMEFGGYNVGNDMPIFERRDVAERRGIRLCYEITQ